MDHHRRWCGQYIPDAAGVFRVARSFGTFGTVCNSFWTDSVAVEMFLPLQRLLPGDSPRLPRMLDLLADRDKLWSDHGMRSLGANDMFYQ